MVKTVNRKSKNPSANSQEKINQIAQSLQDVFGPQIEKIAHSTKFIERNRNFTALQWIQAVVVAFVAKPKATLEEVAEQLQNLSGISLSGQAVSKRFM